MTAVIVRGGPAQNWPGRNPYTHRPGQQHARGSAHIEFQSPGRTSAILKGPSRPRGELFVARRQVIGGAVATTVSPITVNFSGRCLAARRLSSLVNCVQQPTSGFTKTLKSLSSVLRHGSHHVERNVGNVRKPRGKFQNVQR